MNSAVTSEVIFLVISGTVVVHTRADMFKPAEWPVDLHDNYRQNHQRTTEIVTCNAGAHRHQQQDGELGRRKRRRSRSGEQKLCRWWWWFRSQKQSISQLNLFGLLSLLCFATLGTTRVATAAKVGSTGGGGTSNTSLRNIEDENGKHTTRGVE